MGWMLSITRAWGCARSVAWSASTLPQSGGQEEDGIARIYINFCNPWPRLKHNKRRLTHPTKLNQYKEILAKDGEIHFKTDSDLLFDDSLEYFKECGFEITYLTRDLHQSDVKDNIVTEHEKMFSDEGIPIKFLIARYNG